MFNVTVTQEMTLEPTVFQNAQKEIHIRIIKHGKDIVFSYTGTAFNNPSN